MTIKKTKTLKSLKAKLKKNLPDKIMKVIESYEEFSEHEVPDDAKGFTAHHTACKSAVVHAETLLKLAKWTEEDEAAPNENHDEEDYLSSLLKEAEAELDETENEKN